MRTRFDSFFEKWSDVEKTGYTTLRIRIKDENGNIINFDDAIAEAIEKIVKDNVDCYMTPDRAVFNGPATILFWSDDTKTVVKCQDDEPFDPEKGVALAMLKKYFGGSRYNDVLKKLINEAYTCNEPK